MTGSRPASPHRNCTSCDAAIPATRSVCPACGRLQKPKPIPGRPVPAPAEASTPAAGGPGTWSGSRGRVHRPSTNVASASGGAPAQVIDPRRATASTATMPTVRAVSRQRRRRRGPVVLAVLVLAAGAAGAWWVSGAGPRWGADPTLVAQVEGYCDDPRPLGEDPAAFTPGQPAAAHIDLPQPASSLEQPRRLAAPASPLVGAPTLDLEASIGLVSLAVCLDETASEPVGGSCDYELTNPSELGEPASAELLTTTYTAEVFDLRSGEVLATGSLQTAADRCPELAYIGGPGVSNPLEADLVLLWLSSSLPAAAPS